MGVGALPPSLGFKDFHHAARPVVIHKDDYQPCGGEKRAGLRPPPALSFKDVHHPRWGGRRAELGSCPPHGLATRFFLQHSREKGVHQPCGGGELRLRGAGRLQAPSAAACLAPRPGWLWCRLRRCLLLLGRGVAVRPPHGRRSRRAQVGHIHDFSRVAGRTGGSYKTSYAAGAASSFLDGLVLTPAARTGARTSLRALGRQPFAGTTLVCRWPLSSVQRWSPPLVRLPTAEVVASAGETVSATCRWTSGSLALMASLSPPVGRRGRGPFRSGVRAGVIATAGESLVQRWPSPSVLMWSPPLASRSELAIPRPYWCGGSSFLQSRDGTRAPHENRCNTFAFCKVLKSTV
jgi:hypothetical protein